MKNIIKYIIDLFHVHDCNDNYDRYETVKGRWLTRVTWKKCKVCGREFDKYTYQH